MNSDLLSPVKMLETRLLELRSGLRRLTELEYSEDMIEHVKAQIRAFEEAIEFLKQRGYE